MISVLMHCPDCHHSVGSETLFCPECGGRLSPRCLCGSFNRPQSRFCSTCGEPLMPFPDPMSPTRLTDTHSNREQAPISALPAGERKRVTVLFSDLSGYSRLFERLDPEDVREMMTLIFKAIDRVIRRYAGYIDRIIGDEVLAVFGIPRIREDDAVRAVHAALDIHAGIPRLTRLFKGRLAHPLAMHSGIATGLVVTGKMDLNTGRHGITGDTVNQARLLTNQAKAGEILVGPDTMAAASGFFLFTPWGGRDGRGASDPAEAYRVLKRIKSPDKTHRKQGLRSALIGREAELAVLDNALSAITGGSGGCICIAGEAGTGKSRLISEFRRRLPQQGVQWFQGNAYTYTQGIPYFTTIDLLSQAVDLREGDSETDIRNKLIQPFGPLERKDGGVAQILERLFALSSEASTKLTPEAWKLKLLQTLIGMVDTLSKRGRVVICLEDLHWIDPSTVEMFLKILNSADLPVLFIVSYRPAQIHFDPRQIANGFYTIQTVHLEDLSPSMSASMLRSLLGTAQIPRRLLDCCSEQLGGNPFFLEEAVNALVDNGTLAKTDAGWRLADAVESPMVSCSITAVIAARLDRLDNVTKRVVQEASVIGKRFSSQVLKRISEHPLQVDGCLSILGSCGMILPCGIDDESWWQFKHALVREVAYGSLLKRHRRNLHDRIAEILETQNIDRLDACCETLAYHFSNGEYLSRAVDYLIRSGRKGVRKNAVVEAHDYYEKAYQILSAPERLAAGDTRRLLGLLLEWFFVFNMRGCFQDAMTLFSRHEALAMQCDDLQVKGMYLTCMGWIYQRREHLNASKKYLMAALSVGEAIGNSKVIAYTCAYLIWTFTDMGRFADAAAFSDRAQDAWRRFEATDPTWTFETDQNLVRFVLTGTAIAHWFQGDCRQCHQRAERLLAYGESAGDVNSRSEGHLAHAMGYFSAGDYPRCIDQCQVAIDTAAEPLYAFNARFLMAYAYLSLGTVTAAEQILNATIAFCQASGYEYIGSSAKALASIIDVAKGNLERGIKAITEHTHRCQTDGKTYHAQTFHFMLGQIYLRMALYEGRLHLAAILKNLPFLLINLPRAAGKAERHFKIAIQIADQTQALGIKAQACLELARLYLKKKRVDAALPLLRHSIDLLTSLDAYRHLDRARVLLAQATANSADEKESAADRPVDGMATRLPDRHPGQ